MAKLINIRSVSSPSVGLLPLAEDPGTLTLSGYRRETKNGRLPQHGGYLETWQGARLELNMNFVVGTDPDAINNIADEDVTVRMADGSVYLLPQAWVEEPVKIGNGDIPLVIAANLAEKIS
jgi:Phage tail tube protein.